MKKILIGTLVLCLVVSALVVVQRTLVSRAHDAQIRYLEHCATEHLNAFITQRNALVDLVKDAAFKAQWEEARKAGRGESLLGPVFRADTVAQSRYCDALQRVEVERRNQIASARYDRKLAADCAEFERIFRKMEEVFVDTLRLPVDIGPNDAPFMSVSNRWKSTTSELKSTYNAVLSHDVD